MNNNDIMGTRNWKQSQADPFLAQNIAIFGKYLYVDNVDEIFIRIRIFAHVRIIRMNRIFCIRMANPIPNPLPHYQSQTGNMSRVDPITFAFKYSLLAINILSYHSPQNKE